MLGVTIIVNIADIIATMAIVRGVARPSSGDPLRSGRASVHVEAAHESLDGRPRPIRGARAGKFGGSTQADSCLVQLDVAWLCFVVLGLVWSGLVLVGLVRLCLVC